jgi:hypothetical protein
MTRNPSKKAPKQTDNTSVEPAVTQTETAVTVVEQPAAEIPQGWTMIEGGVEAGQPEVVAHVSADVAEVFGMTELVPAGLVVVTDADTATDAGEPQGEPVADSGEWLTDANITAIAAAGEPAAVVEPTTAEQPAAAIEPATVVPEVADIVIRLPGLLTESAARDMAAFYAAKLGQPLELVRAGVTIAMVMPGRAGARAAATPRPATRTEGSNANLDRALAHLNGTTTPQPAQPARDWSTYDAREVCFGGNASNIKVWQQIKTAAEALDIDQLRAFNFAGARDDLSGNTYTKNNGRYLRAMIGKVEAEIEAREAAEVERKENQARYVAEMAEQMGVS